MHRVLSLLVLGDLERGVPLTGFTECLSLLGNVHLSEEACHHKTLKVNYHTPY